MRKCHNRFFLTLEEEGDNERADGSVHYSVDSHQAKTEGNGSEPHSGFHRYDTSTVTHAKGHSKL